METQCKTSVRLLALALGIVGATEAMAATRYFDCASGNMQTASCWSSNIKPVAADDAFIGYASFGANVSATLTSGSLNVDRAYIGHSGHNGVVAQSGSSTFTINKNLYLGYTAGITGSYTLSSGTLTTNADGSTYYEAIGWQGGTGHFTQTGGTHNSGPLYLGVWGTGTYNLSGAGIVTTKQYIQIGGSAGSTGTFTQSGGAVSVIPGYISTLMVGTGSSVDAGSGTYNLSAGSLSSGDEYIGNYGGTGVFNHTGGTNTVNGAAVSTGDGVLGVGAWNGHSATYNLSGTGVLTANHEIIGGGTGGAFIQTGGTNIVASDLSIATYTGTTGTYNLQGGLLKAGIINTMGGGTATFNFTGGTLAVGTFIGNLANNGGTLAPGASPGTTVVQGDYTQGATGTLSIELGGTGAGQFDVLQVTGTAALGGTLDVVFWNSFSATVGDSFDIVSATNLLGGFDTLNLATLGTGLVWNVDYLYDQDQAGTDYVRLSVQAVPEAETYAMMLAGLGLIGWTARRRKTCHAV